MNRKFYLIDRENGNRKIRITMKTIVNHFVGDGTGPVRWHRGNVDLDRFRDDMDEIGYDFVVEVGPASPATVLGRFLSINARLTTAEKKLEALRKNRPRGDSSDRACRKYMEVFFDQQHKVERLREELKSVEAKLGELAECPETPRRRRRKRKTVR